MLKGNTYKILDSKAGVERWNRLIEKAGIDFRLTVPHKAFHRNIGTLAGVKASPDGRVVSDAEWSARQAEWLPSEQDRAYVASLMPLLQDPNTFFYVCGLKSMEEGVVMALRDVAQAAGLDWEALGAELKKHGRLHLETY